MTCAQDFSGRADAGRVRIRSRKWDGSPHRDNLATPLGHDEHGRWLWMRDGEPLLSGDELWHATGGLRLFPPGGAWWSAFFVPRHGPTGRPRQEFVDITTPTTLGPQLIEFIDLDLDVERLDDGPVQVLDRDEFEERRLALGYPEPVVERALETAAAIASSMSSRSGPFDGVWQRWHARALLLPERR